MVVASVVLRRACTHAYAAPVSDEPGRRPRQKYWGLRTLGFLTIALVSLLLLPSVGSAFPLLGLAGGLAGAAYCSYRGLKDFTWLPR